MPFPWSLHRLKMIEQHQPRKKNFNAFHGDELMKEHNYALQKADKPRLRSSTQNIYSVISISAVILKLINDQNHIHFRLIQVLKTGMALHFVTFR